jgi:transcriptional regulator of acetoin/glycerol metabolism
MAENPVILPENLPSKIFNGMITAKQNGIMTLKEAEMIAVKNALDHTSGNVTKAAKILDIGRNTLYDKIRVINS